MTAVDVQGRVQDAIDLMVRGGAEVGLQVAVVRNGRVVVDAVNGSSDAGRESPVAPDTVLRCLARVPHARQERCDTAPRAGTSQTMPGTRFGYHAQTFGFLLGETVRQATGRSLSSWLREITIPLGVEDEVHFGVPGPVSDHRGRPHRGRQLPDSRH